MSRVLMRALQLQILLLVVLATGCGGGPSLPDYAEDVEALVATMNARLDELDAETIGTRDLDEIKRYAQQRIIARSDFLAGMSDLEPPDDVLELHETAVGIMQRVFDSESILADRVMNLESASGIDAIWETPEGIAARAADEQAIALCHAAQSEFDQTADRQELQDVPWIPSEMRSVIVVAFGCDADNR
ncbi:MAG: hypothetical protein DRJ28_01375 [Actinobacteria bacterium]|nr:MAG: hypothetical protein DRJ28_01375 [Actinomycetota bacterium]